MKRAAHNSPKSRPRKKAAPAVAPQDSTPDDSAVQANAPGAVAPNVDPLEGKLSVVLGILFIITALFPRSLKQLLTLSLGGGLLYRGLTGHCGVYQALGVDTHKEPLLKL